jgi:acetyl-CoA carboxylase alpha subunit
LQNAIVSNLRYLQKMPVTELISRREQRINSVGSFREA